jgi:acetate kinase
MAKKALTILALNPGGNSLKAEVISCESGQRHAFNGKKLISLDIDDIGKSATLSKYQGKKAIHTEPIEAANYGRAVESLFRWFKAGESDGVPRLGDVDCVGLRVVHGGLDLTSPTPISPSVEKKIYELEKLAPLHNKSSIEILGPVRKQFGSIPIYGVFDTAFHRTIPEHAALYAIPPDLSKKHHIRRYGFHGISHRYMLERYAHLTEKRVGECSLVTMHLESGCSVSAIRSGASIDNTMGLTPLEGLMMGTRSGDVDPSLLPFLIREEGLELEEVMTLLNKKSGLLGISGESLDTRVLMRQYDTNPRSKLAMDMFSYRVVKAVGANLAAIGCAEGIVFGGGIAENTGFVRERVCNQLRCCGLELDQESNKRLIDIEGRLSTPDSRLQAWVIPTEEGLQIAHETCLEHQKQLQ